VDAHTRFGIASNTKAYTAALMAILVDEGRVAWDDPVVRHLPEFRMCDPAVTQMMTLRDLLCHRSGLPLGAGDLLFFPDTTHVAADVLKALPYLKPERPFRSGYSYDNILYTVAGLVIARVTGKPLSNILTTRLLEPIGELDAVPDLDSLRTDNVAGRHARRGGLVLGEGAMAVVQPQGEHGDAIDADGGINASISDQALWIQTQLGRGVAPNGKRIWSTARTNDMWAPQVITGSSDGPSAENPARPVLQAYALGWFVQDYRGERMINHSGGLTGQVTQTAMLPRCNLGVVVFSNVDDNTSAMLRNSILDHLLGAPPTDWVGIGKALVQKRRQAALEERGQPLDKAPAGGPSLPLDAYVGRYRDPWYGDMMISRQGNELGIAFIPTPGFKGALEPWGPDTFRTRFPPSAGEDALVTFKLENGRVSRIDMKAFSPLADFSFDFQHLPLQPVANERR